MPVPGCLKSRQGGKHHFGHPPTPHDVTVQSGEHHCHQLQLQCLHTFVLGLQERLERLPDHLQRPIEGSTSSTESTDLPPEAS